SVAPAGSCAAGARSATVATPARARPSRSRPHACPASSPAARSKPRFSEPAPCFRLRVFEFPLRLALTLPVTPRKMAAALGDRLMVGRQVLALVMGVRALLPQPFSSLA